MSIGAVRVVFDGSAGRAGEVALIFIGQVPLEVATRGTAIGVGLVFMARDLNWSENFVVLSRFRNEYAPGPQ